MLGLEDVKWKEKIAARETWKGLTAGAGATLNPLQRE